MNSRVVLLLAAGAVLFLLSLPLWFVTLMAVIAGRAWSLATGLLGLALLIAVGAAAYSAYQIVEGEKMGAAREHNMERQVVAVAKKRNGVVTAADLVAAGFSSADAADMLDRMARKGLCDINLDATRFSGVKTYMFPQEVRMRCKYCGTPVMVDQAKCPSCGAPVTWEKAKTPGPSGPEKT